MLFICLYVFYVYVFILCLWLKLNFANTRIFPSNFVGCESSLQSNSLDILALCETNFVDFSNFSVRVYLPLIRKDSIYHIHSITVYVKEGLTFAPSYH